MMFSVIVVASVYWITLNCLEGSKKGSE